MKLIKRFMIAIIFSLLVTGATYVIAQASTQSREAVEVLKQDACSGCHSKFTDAMTASKHGHAINDPLFNQMWTDQGKPGACLVCHVTGYDPALGTWAEDGVTCEACHGPIPSAHITQPSANPVPVDRTSDLCGRCHAGDRFNVSSWQTSTHFQRGMTCTVCHDPHSSSLKKIPGQEDDGPSALCINCHKEVAMNFPYSKHNQKGVSCVDCHLRHFEIGTTDVHAIPDHSFTASITTCSACHSDQMHAQPPAVTPDQTTPTNPQQMTPTPGEVTSGPSPVSPLGFAGFAGLIGLAGGMVLEPWLEKVYRKMNKKDIKK